jgi:hypothetical protein
MQVNSIAAAIESARERIRRGLPRGQRAKRNGFFLLRIEDSPQLAAESFN